MSLSTARSSSAPAIANTAPTSTCHTDSGGTTAGSNEATVQMMKSSVRLAQRNSITSEQMYAPLSFARIYPAALLQRPRQPSRIPGDAGGQTEALVSAARHLRIQCLVERFLPHIVMGFATNLRVRIEPVRACHGPSYMPVTPRSIGLPASRHIPPAANGWRRDASGRVFSGPLYTTTFGSADHTRPALARISAICSSVTAFSKLRNPASLKPCFRARAVISFTCSTETSRPRVKFS